MSNYLKKFSGSINLEKMRPFSFYDDNKNISDNHVKYVLAGEGFVNQYECPVCKSKEREEFVTKSTIVYQTCLNCESVYPELFPKNPSDVYGGEKYVDEFNQIDEKSETYKKTRFGKERLQILKNIFGNLENKKLLDVGCGTGWFLSMCKEEGMKCYGQELGKELSAFTEQRVGVKIFNEHIENIRGHDDYFDVIVLFDLLEHLIDPVSFVNSLKTKLKPAGVILIFTPHTNSFGIQFLKEHSNLLIPTDHLCLFSKKTIIKLSELIDMKLEELSFNGIDMGDYFSYLEKTGYVIDHQVKQKIYNDLQPILDQHEYANHLRFILKKQT
jgi:2-polyprenyl-3-methyl-5-hydroxy-6-metoxy-1,4-benzoquinol methylase